MRSKAGGVGVVPRISERFNYGVGVLFCYKLEGKHLKFKGCLNFYPILSTLNIFHIAISEFQSQVNLDGTYEQKLQRKNFRTNFRTNFRINFRTKSRIYRKSTKTDLLLRVANVQSRPERFVLFVKYKTHVIIRHVYCISRHGVG